MPQSLIGLRGYNLVFWLTITIFIISFLSFTNNIPHNISSFVVHEYLHGIQNKAHNIISNINKDNIHAIVTCIIVLAIFCITTILAIKDVQSSNEEALPYDPLDFDKDLYLDACNDAKQKVRMLVLGMLSRAKEDLRSLELESNIDFSSILYNKLDLVEASDIEEVDIRNIIDNVMSILHFKLMSKNISHSFEDILPYKVKTDPLLLEFFMLSIIQRIVEGLSIGKKIHFKFEQTEEGFLQIIIEDNGYEIDFFDFKLNSLMDLDATSIKLIGYKLDCVLSSTTVADKNIKQIILPPILEKADQDIVKSNIIDFGKYKNIKSNI